MCGFVGVVRKPGHGPVRREELEALLPDLRHRGPDGEGVFVRDRAGVAATRLRIQGNEAGDQPVVSPDGRLALAFNGEILPTAAERLRDDVRRTGGTVPPPEAGDTILLLAALERGICLHEALRGSMGAAAILEGGRGALIATDRLGIKPLFEVSTSAETWFSSRLTPLLRVAPQTRRASPEGLAELLRHQFPSISFPFRGVRANHLWSTSRHGHLETLPHCPGDVACAPPSPTVKDDPPRRLRDAWALAARDAAAVDGPVSLFLSGGLDSAAVAAWCGRGDLLAITGRFGPEGGAYDESAAAASVAAHLGLRHEVVDLSDADLLLDLPDVIRALEIPIAGPGSLALWRLAKRAREHGKVVLTGTGGDEQLAGYARVALALGREGAWTKGYEPLATRMDLRGTDPVARYLEAMDRTTDLLPLLDPGFAAGLADPIHYLESWCGTLAHDPLRGMTKAEVDGTLRALLHVEDRITMAHGLEGRPVPCLGDVPRVARCIPDEWLVGPDGEGKRVLREALKGYVPESVRTDKRKRGFPTPFARAVRGAGREHALAIVEDKRFRERGWWDVDACRRAIDEERPAHDRGLFAMLSWETWARLFLDGDALR